jgi:hypothetical protein
MSLEEKGGKGGSVCVFVCVCVRERERGERDVMVATDEGERRKGGVYRIEEAELVLNSKHTSLHPRAVLLRGEVTSTHVNKGRA